MQLENLSGRRFGKLVVEARAPNVGRNTMWFCACDCGATSKSVRASHLKSGATQSCGCFNTECKIERQTTHGDAPFDKQNTAPEYRIWRHIKSRCLNPKVWGYENYGGRGITICQEWTDDYSVFLAHMGRRPSAQHSIDRIDNNLGYMPGNCRWATREQQSRNRRCIKMTEHDASAIRHAAKAGVTRRALQEQYGVSKAVIAHIVNGRTWKSEHAGS